MEKIKEVIDKENAAKKRIKEMCRKWDEETKQQIKEIAQKAFEAARKVSGYSEKTGDFIDEYDSFEEWWGTQDFSQWIKVTDRLPEDEEQLVLVIDSLRRFYVADYEPLHGRWERLDGFYVDVTHWMPLPEPPKE